MSMAARATAPMMLNGAPSAPRMRATHQGECSCRCEKDFLQHHSFNIRIIGRKRRIFGIRRG
ncbi:unnamed protein product [Gongylonema pulchrum]|uniref:Secreted protein n=1 Tax=Gongylonema pulchrum TaxID=637853 RepID=A0A183DBX6_9BILA|nr:unnamed protein product [Gongylonema pulchrum]